MSKVWIGSGTMVATATLVALAVHPAHARQCAPEVLPSETSDHAYGPRGEVCEGFYRARVGAPDIALVGVMRGRLNFANDSSEVVTLTAAATTDRSLSLRAYPFSVKTYYRMDGTLEPGASLSWPMDVARTAARSGRLTVAAWFVDDDGSTLHVPVRAEPSVATPLDDDRIHLYFRSNAALEFVQHHGLAGGRTFESEVGQRVIRSGQPIIVTLPDGLTGRVEVTATGRVRGSTDQWERETVTVFLGSR